MRYSVWIKHWHENDIGEQGEGPWIFQSSHATREEAGKAAAKESAWGVRNGTWSQVREEKTDE